MGRASTNQTPAYSGPGVQRDHHGPAWLVQAALIARRHFLDGRSKVQIADETGLSRFKVARILDEARSLGLVQVSVTLPADIDPDLSTAVTDAFGLQRAVVMQRVGDVESEMRDALAGTAAQLVSEIVEPTDLLGLTCSRSVAATTRRLDSLAPCGVVQLTGTLAGPDLDSGSVESVRRAAAVGGGKAFPIYAPMLVPDRATVHGLASQSGIAPTMARFGQVSVAVVAVGAWGQGLSTVYAAVSEEERAAGETGGAVGEIGGRLFDEQGAVVHTSVDDRVLGVTLDQLRAIDEVVCLAFDRRRAGAVHAAIVGGVVDTLVCDVSLARELLAGAGSADG